MLSLILYVICAAVAYSTFRFWNWKIIKRNLNFGKLPGKKGNFLLGNTLDFIGPRDELLKRLQQFIEGYEEEGLSKVWLGNEPCVLLFRAHTIEPLVSSQIHTHKSVLYRYTHPWLGLGLLNSYGEKWRERRRMLTPTFHFQILEDFMPIFNEQSKILVENLSTRVGEVNGDIYNNIALCTLDIICATAMGVNLKAQTQPTSDYVQAVNLTAEIINCRLYFVWYQYDLIFNLSPIGRKFYSALKIQHDFTNKIIKERQEEFHLRNEQKKKDGQVSNAESVYGVKRRIAFLDRLVEISDGGKVLTNEDIREEVDTFMFEGHDTTSSGIYWTLYLLGLNPDVQQRVHEELDGVFAGSFDCDVNKEHLQDLKYLECVIKEALRICPPVPFVGRNMNKGLQIGNHFVPEGVTCIIFPYFLHRDEKYFPDPEKFDPDRFTSDSSKGRSPYAYLPFSAGARNCIGQKFALMEEKIVLTHILRKFQVTTLTNAGSGGNMKAFAELVLRPTDDIQIKLDNRTSKYV